MEKPLLTIIVPVYNQEKLITRALDSVPRRDDIEVLVIDDGSTDMTYKVVENYAKTSVLNIRIIRLEENQGLGNAKNVGYDNALGEYINQLDSDDYLYTDNYERVMSLLDGTDMVYMDLKIDRGEIWRVNEATKHLWCGGTLRFIRREFLGDARCPKIVCAEDWYLNEELQKKPHTDKFTGIVGYHYTFPREGSLCDLREKGMI